MIIHSESTLLGAQAKLASEEKGFTLIDVLISIAVLAILGTLALPQYINFSSSFDGFNARSYLIQDLKQAQAEAITRGCREIFSIAEDAKSYSFGCDYLAYDTNVPPQADSISFVRNLPGDVTISASSLIIFNSRGQSVDTDDVISTVSITLWDQRGESPSVITTGTLLGTGVFSY